MNPAPNFHQSLSNGANEPRASENEGIDGRIFNGNHQPYELQMTPTNILRPRKSIARTKYKISGSLQINAFDNLAE